MQAPGPYQQQYNGQGPGPYQQQYNMQAPYQQQYNMQGPVQQQFTMQGQGQGQYGVQQLYSAPMTDSSQQQAQNKQNFSSVIASVIGLGGPILLAAAGLYCMLQGKNNQILLNAGIAMIALAIVFILLACVWFCKHPPSTDSCFEAMMGMSLCTQCCSLAARLAD